MNLMGLWVFEVWWNTMWAVFFTANTWKKTTSGVGILAHVKMVSWNQNTLRFMEPNHHMTRWARIPRAAIWEYHFRYILKKWGWPPWWEVVTLVMATVFLVCHLLGGSFKYIDMFFLFNSTSGNDPIWLIFFGWVETMKQFMLILFLPGNELVVPFLGWKSDPFNA